MTINIKIGGNNEKERLKDYSEFVMYTFRNLENKKYIKEYEGKSLKKNIKKYRKRYGRINHLKLRKMEENKKKLKVVQEYSDSVIDE